MNPRALLTTGTCLCGLLSFGQCTNYSITVGGGTFDFEITWELVDGLGGTVATGNAPTTQNVCLPDGCYSMYMYDSFGDGWNGATFVVKVQPANTTVSSGTLTAGGFGTQQVSLGGGCGGSGNCDTYTLQITGGTFPSEISWNFIGGAVVVANGFAPSTTALCLDTGCYVIQLFDTFGDGWNGATWTLLDASNAVMGTGTLATGSIGQATISLSSTVPCSGGGPVTASDCPDAVNVCTDYSFQVDPNGEGALYEIPPLGSIGNPDLLPGVPLSPWGSDNWGCLRNDELNSTWMVVNIWGSGSLEFTFGGLGSQAGFYDWIMYPYGPTACSDVMNNLVPPVRCNWNGVSTGGTGLAATVPPGGDASNFEPPLTVIAGEQYLICFSNWSSVTTLVPLEFGGTAIVSCDEIVLPVELIAFTASVVHEGVQLDWTTATESGSSHTRVMRSTDLQEWRSIQTVTAAGTSQSIREYSVLDTEPHLGDQFYQLEMIDLDGIMERSPIVSARWESRDILVHPNPTHGTFTIRSKVALYQVMDAMGQDVPFVLRQDGPTQRVRLIDPSPGLHLIIVGAGDHAEHIRLLVW